ncbi:MAG TPA: hypothetical protein PLO44_01770 [Candidatus Paceibacterota bacterium]|nr:hypothetical protein [Candidatus Paceibacterota bacterium]
MKKIIFLESIHLIPSFGLIFFILIVSISSCGPSAEELANKVQAEQKLDSAKISYSFSRTETTGNFSIIPTGVSYDKRATGYYSHPTVFYLNIIKKFNVILNNFEKEKNVRIIHYWIEGVDEDQLYLMVITEPVQKNTLDSLTKKIENQGKEIEELMKLTKKLIKLQKTSSKKLDKILSDSIE